MRYRGRFSQDAPALRARGWRGLVPLRPESKVPALRGWATANEGQTDNRLIALIRSPAGRRPGSGTGAAAGNGLAGVDLDISEPASAVRAVAIAEDVLGPTPLHRVGKPPKRMLFYRSEAPRKRVNPASLALEIYPGGRPATGQVALLGAHPAGHLYTWPVEDPRRIPLAQLPEIGEEHLEVLVEALAADPLIQAHGRVRPQAPRGGDAAEGSWEAAARAAAQTPDGLPAWLATVNEGGRHYAAVAAVVITMKRGLEPDEEAAELRALERAFLAAKPGTAGREWDRLVAWARLRVAPRYTRRQLIRRLGLEVSHG